MNKENLFSSSTEYKLNSINCNILTPLGTTDISKSSINEVAYSQSTSDKNFTNNCIGISGYVEIKLRSHFEIGDGNLPTHLYIPKTPVLCDAVSVPVMCDDSALKGRGFVAMHYNFVQPLFMPVETGHMERYPLTTPRDSIYGARSLLMRNGNKQTFGIATNYLFSRIHEYDEDADESDSVYAHEADILVSDDPSIAAKTDGLCESALYIDKIDLLRVDFNYDGTYTSPHLKIKYAVIPITGFAATSQSLSPELDWSSKISGSQKVALIPISAAHCNYTNDDNTGGWSSSVRSEATTETKSIAIEYPARLVNANNPAAFDENCWKTSIDQNSDFNEIYRDNEYSIHSVIITYTRENSTFPSGNLKYQFSLGIRKAGTDRTAFPSNYSPINYSESYAELPEHESAIDLSAAYPIISIDKIRSDNKGASYNIKFGIDKDDPLLNYLEYSNGCGYFIVNISCSTLESISQAYGMCGSISEHLVCENMIVKKNSVLHTPSLSHLWYKEDYIYGGPYDYDSKTPVISGNYLEVRELGSKDENIPINSVVSSVNTYEGNSDYIGAGDSTMHSMWDGRATSIFSPVISSDGHGETQIRQASHLLTNSKFPVIIPSAVFYNSIDTNNELYIVATKATTKTWKLTIPYRDNAEVETTVNSYVIRDNEVPIIDLTAGAAPEGAVNNYGWYLNLLICAVETHLWLHGIKFLACCLHSYAGEVTSINKGRSYSVNTYGWLRSSMDAGQPGDRPHTVYPMVGCLNFYDTPVIGTGNTPVDALFSKAEIGIDISGYGMLSTPSTTYFNNKMLMLADDTVYETLSKYSRTSDLSTKYEILRESSVSRIYAIGNYLVVGTSSSVSIFTEYNQTVSILSTIPGQLMLGVSMSHDSLYFAVLNNSNIVVYEVSRDGIIPIHESSGSKAIVSNSLSLGTTVNIYNNGDLSVYSIARGQCILVAELETTTAWSVDDIILSSAGIETHCIAILSSGDIKIAKEIVIGDDLEEYELTSSEFVFPKLADGGYLLSGVRLIFDIEPDEYAPEHSTFNFSVKINDEIEYAIEGASVTASKTLLFDAYPATYASYTISKCLVPLRGIRWLVQRIPEPIYSQLECDTIIAIHSLPGYIFVSYNDLTVAYAMYGSGASKIATVKGLLQNHPVADQNGVYFAVKRGDSIIAHMLSRDGAVPVYQTYGESATMSCEFKSGVSMAVLEEGTVYVYSIDRGNVVYKGQSKLPFDVDSIIVSGCGDAAQTLIVCTPATGYSLYYSLAETPYDMDIDIESSEYHIAETQYGKPVLTGVRVEFDYEDNKTFDIDIYVDDELHSTHTNLEVGRDVTIPIVPVIGEQLSYEIKNCGATVRGVKWLVYNLPLRIYNLLETELVEDIIVIGQYVFVSYNETTVVYATANGQAEIMATVVGKLMKFPAQEEGDVYFAVSKDGMIYAYYLSREGIIPVYELEGIKAVVSTEQGIGIILSVLGDDIVTSYRLTNGNVIYLGKTESTPLSIITNIGTYREGDTVSVAVRTSDPFGYTLTNNILSLNTSVSGIELESSEFIFPYRDGRYMLFGLKIVFDKVPEIKEDHNSFDLSVYANDKLHYVSNNNDVEAEVVIRFPAIPVGYARYKIGSCYQHIRAVKWLAYRLPFINEAMFNKGKLIVEPDLLFYEDVVVGGYEIKSYRLAVIGKATEPVVIDPKNKNFSLSLSEHGAYTPRLSVAPSNGVIDTRVYVKCAPIVSGFIETRIINSYKGLRAYVNCIAWAIEEGGGGGVVSIDMIREELSSRVAQYVLAMTDEDLGGTYEDGVISGVGVLEIDGVKLSVNSRVLLNAQIDPIQNGIYSVDSQNPWRLSRVPELSQGKVIVPGTIVYVVGSDRLERRVLAQISTEGLIGKAPLNYEQISIYKALLDCGEW